MFIYNNHGRCATCDGCSGTRCTSSTNNHERCATCDGWSGTRCASSQNKHVAYIDRNWRLCEHVWNRGGCRITLVIKRKRRTKKKALRKKAVITIIPTLQKHEVQCATKKRRDILSYLSRHGSNVSMCSSEGKSKHVSWRGTTACAVLETRFAMFVSQPENHRRISRHVRRCENKYCVVLRGTSRRNMARMSCSCETSCSSDCVFRHVFRRQPIVVGRFENLQDSHACLNIPKHKHSETMCLLIYESHACASLWMHATKASGEGKLKECKHYARGEEDGPHRSRNVQLFQGDRHAQTS